MRNIFIVNADQVVVSQNHPEGVYSVIDGYPARYDSRNYGATAENPNGSEELALIVAKADFADRVKQLSLAGNRAMWSVTLTTASGRQVQRDSRGAFPDMTPIPPQPEPEAEVTEDAE